MVGLTSDCNPSELSRQLLCTLKHRGPDGGSVYIDGTNAILVHTRLAIIDLSSFGAQPMTTPGGRYTITFNGEIYNYRELKAELVSHGVSFQGDSDTEVLLHLYAILGESAIEKLKGMFVFAVWDHDEQSLFIARDALGIKPLYYHIENGRLCFASEVTSLVSSKLVRPDLDQLALAGYLQYGSVQEPSTLIRGVQSLPAGSVLKWQAGVVSIREYWYPRYPADGSSSKSEAIAVTRTALLDSVSRHLVSDVPVGIFLSGGIDSTALLSLARAAGANDLRTFCISFEETDYDEGAAARKIAEHYGAEHSEWKLTASECQSLIGEYFDAVDQPSCDGINTWCISRFARQCGMKVVLSGLGGDELFGSYPSFQQVPTLVKYHRGFARVGLAQTGLAGRLCHFAALVAKRFGKTSSTNRLERLSQFLRSDGSYLSAYWTMRGFFTTSETRQLLREYCQVSNFEIESTAGDAHLPIEMDPKDVVSYLETTRFMRNQLLRDSDVMSMAHGLELRTPLVDRTLFDVVNRIPSQLRHEPGKRLLVDAVGDIPEWVQNAPKHGFSFPFDLWVNRNWQAVFGTLQDKTKVSLSSWYRKWALLSLDRFLEANGIRCVA